MDDKYSSEWPPVDLSDIGEIREAEQECPGVYYISIRRPTIATPIATEYYLVLPVAPISAAARRFGQALDNDILMFPIDDESGHSKVIEYEIAKYKLANGLPIDEDIHQLAAYGAELDPYYFGMIPPPLQTPWGRTLRHKTLDNGVHWLETDQFVTGLAIAFPVWDDLTDTTLESSEKMPEDGEEGYRFFREGRASVAVFELFQTRTWWYEADNIIIPALMNAMHEQNPGYVVTYNRLEQEGLHDLLGLLLSTFGVDADAYEGSENMIRFTPGAGTDFILW